VLAAACAQVQYRGRLAAEVALRFVATAKLASQLSVNGTVPWRTLASRNLVANRVALSFWLAAIGLATRNQVTVLPNDVAIIQQHYVIVMKTLAFVISRSAVRFRESAPSAAALTRGDSPRRVMSKLSVELVLCEADFSLLHVRTRDRLHPAKIFAVLLHDSPVALGNRRLSRI
jgi:hypothetical protein